MTEAGNPLSRLSREDRRRRVRYLHPGPKHARLVEGGLSTVGRLVDDAAAGFPILRKLPAMGRQSQLAIQQRLAALSASVLEDGAVDWPGFDQRCGMGPDGEEGPPVELGAPDRKRPVAALHLGTRTARLDAGGLKTVGNLLDDREDGFASIYALDGAGRGLVTLVRQRLVSLEACVDEGGGVDWRRFDRLWDSEGTDVDEGPEVKPLSEAALARPVEVLRLGVKAKFLHDAGLHSLGDLYRDGVTSRLRLLPGIGPKNARLIPERLAVIRSSALEGGGEPDWDAIAGAWGFPAAPAEPVDDSQAFLAALPGVIATVIAAHDSEMDRLILSERISKPRRERMTLEALGSAFDLTRERVRQRQVRLLDTLSDALINDDQSRLPVHFRETFRAFWVRAAEYFSGVDELDYQEFEHGLEITWTLPAGQLAPFMPLAIAILADGVRIPTPGPDLHPALNTLDEAELDRPLRDFPLRRAREGLEHAGLTTLGDLLDAARDSRLPSGRDGRVALEVLNGVGAAVAAGVPGDVDAWAAGLGLTALPRVDPRDGAGFLNGLDGALEAAAELNATSGRAGRIYRMRTCIPRRRRPTLDDMAVKLSSHGPTIKREESVLLASLHAQLVEEDMTDARVVWRPGFLRFFARAAELHEFSSGDYNRFCASLGREWNLDGEDIREQAEGLWAVLSLYPGGRRARLMPNRQAPVRPGRLPATAPPAPAGGVVMLRGFRRPH